MPTLFLIDQSLKDESGHHFDYSKCIADEATAQGFQVVVGSNVSYRCGIDSFGNAAVRPVFRNTTYSELSALPGLRKITRSRQLLPGTAGTNLVAGFRNRLLARKVNQRRDKYVAEFLRNCKTFFDGVSFSKNDHIFLITLSELELSGLAQYLSASPNTKLATWHLQFHFDLFVGRPAEFESQGNLSNAAIDSFHQAALRLTDHRIFFYTTSVPLAEQYNQIPNLKFAPLAYPVNPRLQTCSNEPNSPLRITCAGGFRREKGVKDFLAPLVSKASEASTLKAKVKFFIQGKPNKTLQRLKTRHDEMVELLPHPLPEKDYVRMIQDSDIGLLYYDSRTYYSRRAGILGEFLSCGKPVIVPAGCWLGEQIAEANFQYAEKLFAAARLNTPNLSKFGKFTGENAFTFGSVDKVSVAIKTEERSGLLVLKLKWATQLLPGRFCKITLRNPSTNNTSQVKIVGTRNERDDVYVVFEKPSGQNNLWLDIRNPYDERELHLQELTIKQMINDDDSVLPVGVVGCAVAQVDQLVPAIEQICRHYGHYKTSSESFSRLWNSNHRPSKTLAQLLANGRSANAA